MTLQSAAAMPPLRAAGTPRAADGTAARFTGYASLFNRADLVGDMVMSGAFARSLAQRGACGVRMLWQHDPGAPIGVWEHIGEDARGLFVAGRLLSGVALAHEARILIRAGAIDGLSIGYRVERAAVDRRTGRRLLRQLKLLEISLVTFPLQPEARVHR